MLKVLIAEDDLMLADRLTNALISAGYEVCGVARTVAEGVALGRAYRPDLAVVDIRLAGGGLGTELVTRLRGVRRLGVLYASSYIAQAIDLGPGDACIAKPYQFNDLLCALRIVAGGSRFQAASEPRYMANWLSHPGHSTCREAASHGRF